jgi:hypothetical protein
MVVHRSGAVIAMAAMLAMTAFGQDVVEGSNDLATAGRWVKTINTYRCVSGMGPVAWSPPMAADAQTYVDSLTDATHTVDPYKIPAPAGPAGESLAKDKDTLEKVVESWYMQIDNCAAWPGCTAAKPGTVVGDFTALSWRGVTQVGCAKNLDKNIYICRFRSGDTLGKWTANMPGAYPESVSPSVKPVQFCESSTNGVLYPPLPDPASLYPETITGWAAAPYSRAALERAFAIAVCVAVCVCLCSCWCFLRSTSGANKTPLPGTIRNQKPNGPGYETLYPGMNSGYQDRIIR